MRTYLDMEKAPLVSKAIFVYPDGLPPADNPSKAWDLTAAGMDMPFFDAMLAQMSADYCVDPGAHLRRRPELRRPDDERRRLPARRRRPRDRGGRRLGPHNTSQCKGR